MNTRIVLRREITPAPVAAPAGKQPGPPRRSYTPVTLAGQLAARLGYSDLRIRYADNEEIGGYRREEWGFLAPYGILPMGTPWRVEVFGCLTSVRVKDADSVCISGGHTLASVSATQRQVDRTRTRYTTTVVGHDTIVRIQRDTAARVYEFQYED